MQEEDLAHNVGSNGISGSKADSLNDSGGQQAVESCRKTASHRPKYGYEHRSEQDWPAPKGVSERHPEDVGQAEHEYVDRHKMRQLRERARRKQLKLEQRQCRSHTGAGKVGYLMRRLADTSSVRRGPT